MPELPEVETIRNELAPWIVGQSFTRVTIIDSKVIPGCSARQVRHGLIGRKVESLGRRGKYLIFHLSNGNALIIHLRMTGSLLLDPSEDGCYVRAAFCLSNGHRFVFSDRRRLGKMWLSDDADAMIRKLGPEPLDKRFTPRVLRQRLNRHHIPIKAALLDQGIVAGIGNMYADEALFDARVHPLTKSDELSAKHVQTLHNSICRILRAAIGSKGASVDTYVRPDGELGTAQFDFKVAHRGGELCPVCGGPIERIVVQNRGTYFCPRCQRLHRSPRHRRWDQLNSHQ